MLYDNDQFNSDFLQGQKDCIEGRFQKTGSAWYLRGYYAQKLKHDMDEVFKNREKKLE